MSDETKIIVIGPQAVGKTTYLSTLLYYFDPAEKRVSGIWVEPLSQNAEDLKEDAGNILFTRDRLNASKDATNYRLRFHIDGHFLKQSKPKEIVVEVSDYAGEIFQSLDESEIPPAIVERIQQCSTIPKWLLLLNDWEPHADRKSKRRLENLLKQVPYDVLRSLRIAVVMSKCERGELWSGRKEAEEDIFAVHLPATWGLLRQWFRQKPQHLQFFACSSFGVLGPKEPLPNRVNHVDGDHSNAVLRNPDVWRPYGLITPFVWLDFVKNVEGKAFNQI